VSAVPETAGAEGAIPTVEEPGAPAEARPPASRSGGGALAVASGIFASRIIGFVRERALAHYFGVGPHLDVFRAALRAPNVLQNLLGEGTLSASFIPVYSRLLEEGRKEEAGKFAGAIFGLLLAAGALLSLLGFLAAPLLVAVLSAGFLRDRSGVDRYALTVTAVRIIFPMTAFLILSAWALGVLNSHRRFFLPYVAPVLWNSAIIGALAAGGHLLWRGGGARLDHLLISACVGALLGGILQFSIQLPLVLKLLSGLRLSSKPFGVPGVRQALAALGPVVAGRGAVQLSSYLDGFLASCLAAGALSAVGLAQNLYILPGSLFGASIAASQLPEMARLAAVPGGLDRGRLELLAERVRGSLSQIAFLNVPTAIGYLVFGFLLVGALYRTGTFGRGDNWLVYWILAGYTLGLLAATSARLLQNTFYALGDTRTPARIAAVRIAISGGLSVPLMLWLDRQTVSSWLGPMPRGDLHLGAVGLAVASGLGAWWELIALERALGRRFATPFFPVRTVTKMLLLAAASAVPALALWRILPRWSPILSAAVVVGCFGACYLAAAALARLPELDRATARLRRRHG
jgi:putative peptidoglycan lipid II flippase